MPLPTRKQSRSKPDLLVRAVAGAEVREIDTQTGRPLMACRYVGYDENHDIVFYGVLIPDHPHYRARIAEGSLLLLQ